MGGRPIEPHEGSLILAVSEDGDRRPLKVHLLDNGGGLLPPLLQAQVTRITRNGLVLKGVELTSRVPGSIKAKVSTRAQTWWVLVHTSDLTGMYDDHDPLNEIAERQGPGNGCWPAS